MIERRDDGTFDWPVYAGGTVPVQWYFRKQTELPVAVQAWTIAPGASEGAHVHHPGRPLEELYIVVEGDAEVMIDGRITRMGAGDALLAKVGAEHDVRNVGEGSLRLIVVWGPPDRAIWAEYSMGRFPDEAGGSPAR
ncbi:cupin domain-containing protein [Mycobacterium sp. DL99]|uniref:cupin domain-containing protein n=1 Tax=Mycobacterium sp. DL99 TaxID=2528957 RepID=UPI001436A6F2|nr:cupin domain-containing protein [Mycobacterium sp. DL99]